MSLYLHTGWSWHGVLCSKVLTCPVCQMLSRVVSIYVVVCLLWYTGVGTCGILIHTLKDLFAMCPLY